MEPLSCIIPFVPGATMTRHLPQQTTEPHVLDLNQMLVLDPRDPMAIARRLVADKFLVNGQQALYRHREEFFKFSCSSYRAVDDDTIRAEIWSYLERAYKVEMATYSPFKPANGSLRSEMVRRQFRDRLRHRDRQGRHCASLPLSYTRVCRSPIMSRHGPQQPCCAAEGRPEKLRTNP